jgi:hypothetical protein
VQALVHCLALDFVLQLQLLFCLLPLLLLLVVHLNGLLVGNFVVLLYLDQFVLNLVILNLLLLKLGLTALLGAVTGLNIWDVPKPVIVVVFVLLHLHLHLLYGVIQILL